MRRVLFGVAALGAVVAGSLASPAAAGGRWHEVHVETTAASVSTTYLGSPSCDAAGNCLVSYTFTAQQFGGLDGTLTNDGTLWLEAGSSDFQVSIIGLFTGTVDGCGQGSMALSFPLTTGSATTAFSGRDEIVPSSGTGDLAGISGTGTYQFDPVAGTSAGTLKLRCQPH